MSGYDIIGDIHAQADNLRQLLRELGYRGPYFTHPGGRTAIFLGDFINRGPKNRETIEIVKGMIDRGAKAVMGNHEFKAIAYAREGIHGHIRPHTAKNTAEQAGFLHEYKYGSPEYGAVIDWFEGLPVYLDMRQFRVVHACWSPKAAEICRPYLRKDTNALKQGAYKAYDTENVTRFSQSLDTLLKGPSYKLPRAVHAIDAQGHPVKILRLLWWAAKGASLPDLLEKAEQVEPFFSEQNRKAVHNLRNSFNKSSQNIVFIGHYNVKGEPALVSETVACLNFRDRLVAYRWNAGDKALSPDRLVYV